MMPDMILNMLNNKHDLIGAWIIILSFGAFFIYLGWKTFGPKEFDDETYNWASNNDLYNLPKKERLRAMRIYQKYIDLHKEENLQIMKDYINSMEKEINSSDSSKEFSDDSSEPPSKSEQP